MISPIYSPKLSLPRQGRRVVDKSSLGRLSGLDGYEHGFQCQFESRRPHFVRRVGTASLKPVSSSGLFILALCWLSSVIGGVSFFRRLPPECVMLLLLHEASAGACRSQ